MKSSSVLRHTVLVRSCHWLIALSGLLLCFSGIGFMPLYGRFYLNALPGMAWVSDFDIQMTLHYLTAAIFSAAVCFHLCYHLRRKQLALLPKRGDLRESWLILKAMVLRQKEPAHGKFLAEQRLAYLAIGLCSLLLIASGLILSFKNGGPALPGPLFIQAVTLLHLGTTFLFMFLVLLHLAAFLIGENRPLLPSMLTGRIDAAYARRRHPRWRR